jgi:hypothetical protein
MESGITIDAVLTHVLAGPWVYTLSRAVLLLVALITWHHVRRYPWLWAGMAASAVLLTLRVAADVLGGHGASTAYTVYYAGGNLGLMLLYIGASRMAMHLDKMRQLGRLP